MIERPTLTATAHITREPSTDYIVPPPALSRILEDYPQDVNEMFYLSSSQLEHKKRAGGITKMWDEYGLTYLGIDQETDRVDGTTYSLNPQTVKEHTFQVVENVAEAATLTPDLENYEPDFHKKAVLMADLHDIGEGSREGDLPASATPETYTRFHTFLAHNNRKLLVIEHGMVVGLSEDPEHRGEIEIEWEALKKHMRDAEEQHAAGLINMIDDPNIREEFSRLRQRFEDRDKHPEDVLAHYVRAIGDIRAEFTEHSNRHSWREHPYPGSALETDAVLKGSIDISIGRMMKSAVCLAHHMQGHAREVVRQMIADSFRNLVNSDYPEKAEQAIAFLNDVWNCAQTEEADQSIDAHLQLVKQKHWLNFPTT